MSYLKIKKLTFFILTLFMCAIGAFHFSMVVIYNSPMNPVKLKHYIFIHRYMEPVFAQDWRLFSPNPPDYDIIVHLKCKLIQKNNIIETKWLNITTPSIKKHQKNRFSPYNALIYMLTATHTNRQIDPKISEVLELELKNQPDSTVFNFMKSDIQERTEFADSLTSRIASFYALDLFQGNYEIKETKIMWELYKFPPYSKRKEDYLKGESLYLEGDWMPFDSSILKKGHEVKN